VNFAVGLSFRAQLRKSEGSWAKSEKKISAFLAKNLYFYNFIFKYFFNLL